MFKSKKKNSSKNCSNLKNVQTLKMPNPKNVRVKKCLDLKKNLI
jgi:hypothetical protein